MSGLGRERHSSCRAVPNAVRDREPRLVTFPPLDVDFAHLADFDSGIGGTTADLVGMRSALVQMIDRPPPVDGVAVGQARVGAGPEVTIETFTPEAEGPRPAILWFHGGGFVVGSAGMDADRLQRWSRQFRCFAGSVEYRLAPEHPYPAAHRDGVAALEWLIASADELALDVGRIVVAGASAGGGLAAGVALAARDRGIRLAGQLLFYPMLDDRQVTASSQWPTAVWSRDSNEFGWRSYLGTVDTREIADYAAPSRATLLDDLPPTMILVGGSDAFVDEDIDYAARLAHAGVATDLRVYAGAPHGFDLLVPESITSCTAADDAERWLEKVLGRP